MKRVFRPLGSCFVPWSLLWTPALANDNGLGDFGHRLDFREGRFVRVGCQ